MAATYKGGSVKWGEGIFWDDPDVITKPYKLIANKNGYVYEIGDGPLFVDWNEPKWVKEFTNDFMDVSKKPCNEISLEVKPADARPRCRGVFAHTQNLESWFAFELEDGTVVEMKETTFTEACPEVKHWKAVYGQSAHATANQVATHLHYLWAVLDKVIAAGKAVVLA